MYRWRAFESICELLVRAVEEGSKRPSKSLKSSKLRRTSTLTFSKTGLKLPTEKQLLHLSLGAIEYATNTNKKILLHIQNKSNYIYLWWKEKGTALFLLNVQSKSADFCCFHRHIENEATTMQRNRSAHTARFWGTVVMLQWRCSRSVAEVKLRCYHTYLTTIFPADNEVPSFQC